MNSSLTQDAESYFVCPLCDAENKLTAKFCRHCGVSRNIMSSWGAPPPSHSARKDCETPTSLKPPLDALTWRRHALSAGAVNPQQPASPLSLSSADEVKQDSDAGMMSLASLRQSPGLTGEETAKLEPYVLSEPDLSEPSAFDYEVPLNGSGRKQVSLTSKETAHATPTPSTVSVKLSLPKETERQEHAAPISDVRGEYEQIAHVQKVCTQASHAEAGHVQAVHTEPIHTHTTQVPASIQNIEPIQSKIHPPECPGCFGAVRRTDKFCCWCGECQPERYTATELSCSSCSVPLPSGANFCFMCGKSVVAIPWLRRVSVELFKQEESEFFPTFQA
jgi:hypothetical protein